MWGQTQQSPFICGIWFCTWVCLETCSVYCILIQWRKTICEVVMMMKSTDTLKAFCKMCLTNQCIIFILFSLAQYIPTMDSCVQRLIRKLNIVSATGQTIDMWQELGNMTLEVVGECAYGWVFSQLQKPRSHTGLHTWCPTQHVCWSMKTICIEDNVSPYFRYISDRCSAQDGKCQQIAGDCPWGARHIQCEPQTQLSPVWILVWCLTARVISCTVTVTTALHTKPGRALSINRR